MTRGILTSINLRSLLVSGLLVISVLASGCTTICGWTSPPSATVTPVPLITPAPLPSATSGPAVTPVPLVTATPTQLPSVTPVSDPMVVQPGWPNYGVNQTLNMFPPAATPTATPSPTPTPTGSIFGHFIVGYSPIDPESFQINATADRVTYHISPVNADGTYLLAGLSFGTYEVGYESSGYGPGYFMDAMVTIDSANPDVEHDIYLMM